MKSYIKNNWKLLLNVFTLIALALAVFYLRDDLLEVWSKLSQINLLVLLLMIPLQIMNYSCWTHVYYEFLGIIAKKERINVGRWDMYKIMLELNFVNVVFPTGGVSGFPYLRARLKPYGISTSQSTFTQAMRFMLTFGSYIILLFIGLFMLALGGSASNMTILVACSLAFLVLFGTIVVVFTISSRQRIKIFTQALTRMINKVIQVVRPKHPESLNLKMVEKLFDEMHENYSLLRANWRELRSPLVYSLLGNITELATIYVVYIAAGAWVNPGAVIIAFALASVAGFWSILPGGAGIYEALMTTVMISAGVPAGLSLSVTLIYRVINMLLSIPLGYYFYNKAIPKLNLDPETFQRKHHKAA
jgi:uncharacterized protein (TIRG00374 family)